MKSLLIIVLALCIAFPQVHAAEDTQKVETPKDFDNGFKVALEIMKELGQVEDAEKARRVNDIGYRVAQRSDPNATNYSFRVVKMEEPNAFALPGGFIFVTTGMLDLDLTDDELAALLGHEITHVRNEHSRRTSKRQTIMNLLYQALVLGIAFGLKDSNNSGYDPITGYPRRSAKSEILQGSAAFGLVFQELLLRGFSRDLELEADHEGMIAASRAGFSPEGTMKLFDKMRQRIYEAPGYGYWRTHPYLDDRMEVARSLQATFEPAKNPADATEYRIKTQDTFVKLIANRKEEEEKKALRKMALNAYSKGKTADELRWWFIHDAEMKERDKEPFYRDYGKLVKMYEENIAEIKDTPESVKILTEPNQALVLDVRKESEYLSGTELLKKLERNLQDLRKELVEAAPLYEEVLNKEMFDTEMLQRYLSNYPESPRIAEAKYRLAENYRILKKNSDSVQLYLEVISDDKANGWREKSRTSLLHMIPSLDDLSACYKIAQDSKDQTLQRASDERMKELADSFTKLENGYEFRRKYPTSAFEKPVREQMTKLASDTLHQAKLYQAVGEYQKALDHYNQILRFCSDLPVADQVKDTMIDFQEVQSLKS
ncbi:MAG TPA: M48 family metalloprotease [Acidobacteriota bacterium]|nr:M48 family metalloprotease [Acidobacteriota bacterium]